MVVSTHRSAADTMATHVIQSSYYDSWRNGKKNQQLLKEMVGFA